MSEYKPLKYREVVRILTNLGFEPKGSRSTSHQTWICKRGGKYFAVTLAFHGGNTEFRSGTLSAIIRQSGVSKEAFYKALKSKK